jgi:hypothetical protein
MVSKPDNQEAVQSVNPRQWIGVAVVYLSRPLVLFVCGIITHKGAGRFPSIRSMVEPDLTGWLPVMGRPRGNCSGRSADIVQEAVQSILGIVEPRLAAELLCWADQEGRRVAVRGGATRSALQASRACTLSSGSGPARLPAQERSRVG